MQKWEYKILNVDKMFYYHEAEEKISELFNILGEEGWELVGYVAFEVHVLAFKRPIE